ncbi:unnamed protein product [Ceratitis capitata]|uniref:(Mediterranean fruit fly) hypothetical protein n=1 Tax=Ceratitis capitata TaxID=7213 RepID=A0A811UV30_CERCA|nr:unnamed protein product [Ceratitis capitata]
MKTKATATAAARRQDEKKIAKRKRQKAKGKTKALANSDHNNQSGAQQPKPALFVVAAEVVVACKRSVVLLMGNRHCWAKGRQSVVERWVSGPGDRRICYFVRLCCERSGIRRAFSGAADFASGNSSKNNNKSATCRACHIQHSTRRMQQMLSRDLKQVIKSSNHIWTSMYLADWVIEQ